jgi:DNA-binding transcriptional MerR regulator
MAKDKFISAKDICERLSVPASTIRGWDKQGITKPIYIGGVKRYRESEIEDLIQRGGSL